VPRGRVTAPARSGAPSGIPLAAAEADATAPAAVAAQYAFVRRDLARIFVLAVAMFVLIVASTYVLK
jgi:hypothetical protein